MSCSFKLSSVLGTKTIDKVNGLLRLCSPVLNQRVGMKSLASLPSHKVFSLTLSPPGRMQQSAASGGSCVKAMRGRTLLSRLAPAQCVCECVCVCHDSRRLQTAWPLQCNLRNETCRRLGSELGGELAAPHLLLLLPSFAAPSEERKQPQTVSGDPLHYIWHVYSCSYWGRWQKCCSSLELRQQHHSFLTLLTHLLWKCLGWIPHKLLLKTPAVTTWVFDKKWGTSLSATGEKYKDWGSFLGFFQLQLIFWDLGTVTSTVLTFPLWVLVSECYFRVILQTHFKFSIFTFSFLYQFSMSFLVVTYSLL